MKIRNEWKHKLNEIIAYRRKEHLLESKNDIWKQVFFYMDSVTKVSICSCTTYSRLENDKILAHDDIYYFASKKLQRVINQDEKINMKIARITDSLFNSIQRYNVNSIRREYTIHNSFLNKLHIYMVYGEWASVLLHIMEHYMNGKEISKKSFHEIDSLFRIYPYKIQEIVKHLLFHHVKPLTKQEIAYIYTKFDYKNSEYLPNEVNYTLQLIFENTCYLAILQIQRLIEKAILYGNPYELSQLYIHLAYILVLIDEEQCKLYLVQAKQIIKKSKFVKEKEIVSLYYLASVAIRISYYEFALSCMKEYIENDHHKIRIRDLNLIWFCTHMLYGEIENMTLLEIGEDCRDIDKAIRIYYKHYKERSYTSNYMYIMKCVSPLLKQYDLTYVFMMETELRLLCEKTNHFKQLYTFRKVHGL